MLGSLLQAEVTMNKSKTVPYLILLKSSEGKIDIAMNSSYHFMSKGSKL